jgi:hypothetical protein
MGSGGLHRQANGKMEIDAQRAALAALGVLGQFKDGIRGVANLIDAGRLAPRQRFVQGPGCFEEHVIRLERQIALKKEPGKCCSEGEDPRNPRTQARNLRIS